MQAVNEHAATTLREAGANTAGVSAAADGEEPAFERLPRTVLTQILETLVANSNAGNVVALALVRLTDGGPPWAGVTK